MTVVALASIKGAPGVTTLACLVAATWPEERRVLVAECDPSGGDLAGRFQLSSKCGWSSFVTAARRRDADAVTALERHLQQLPGGLEVLIAARGADQDDSGRARASLLASVTDRQPTAVPGAGTTAPGVASPAAPAAPTAPGTATTDTGWDVVVDLGRLLPIGSNVSGWLDVADAVLVVLFGDAASVLHVKDRAAELVDHCGDRLGLVVVENGGYAIGEIEEFTGIRVVGVVPYDPEAASVASGRSVNERRLARSPLIAATQRLADTLNRERAEAVESPVWRDQPSDTSAASTAPTVPARGAIAAQLRRLRGVVPTRTRSTRPHPDGANPTGPAPAPAPAPPPIDNACEEVLR